MAFSSSLLLKPSLGQIASLSSLWRQHSRYQGCVGHWLMTEKGGSRLFDLGGYGNHGTLTAMDPATDWLLGAHGPVLDFDGVDDYVDCGNPASLQLTKSMTIATWYKFTGTPPGSDYVLLSKKDQGDSGYTFSGGTVDNGPIQGYIQVAITATTEVLRYSTTTLVAGTWYHLCGVYNAVAQTLSMHLNGVLDNGSLVGTVPSAQYNPAASVKIGTRTTTSGLFTGQLEDIRIYNRALLASEVLSLYTHPFLEFGWAARRRFNNIRLVDTYSVNWFLPPSTYQRNMCTAAEFDTLVTGGGFPAPPDADPNWFPESAAGHERSMVE